MGTVSQLAPDFLKNAYSRSRLVLRSAALRFGSGVATCNVRHVAIRLGISSEIEQFRAATYATKEPETLDWLDKELKDGDVFFDVGANIGLYSLYAAKLRPRCAVFAFEPESQNFARLCNNVSINRAANIVPCGLALSDGESFDYLSVSSMAPGSALHSLPASSESRKRPVAQALRQGVLSTTLDALVKRHGLPSPALLKIDVDGVEDRILNGAGVLLRSAALRTMIVELNFRDAAEFAASTGAIGAFGFKLGRQSDWIWEQNGLKSRNCIFYRT
jgi:FkbM family methyltransferase